MKRRLIIACYVAVSLLNFILAVSTAIIIIMIHIGLYIHFIAPNYYNIEIISDPYPLLLEGLLLLIVTGITWFVIYMTKFELEIKYKEELRHTVIKIKQKGVL